MKYPDRSIRTAVSIACLVVVGVILVLMEYPDRGFAFKGESRSPLDARAQDVTRLVELTQAVGLLRENYAFQARLLPRHMLFAALQGVEDAMDFIMVSPNVNLDDRPLEGNQPLPERFTVQVRGKSHSFTTDKVDDLYQMTWKLLEVFNHFEEDEETQRKMEDAAIEGMVSVLDPHTVYLDEAAFNEMKMSTRGSFGGLGIVISVRDGKLKVISVFPNSPAARGELKKGDHIVRIGDESTINMLVSEAANRMRGKPGTQVAIWIKRDSFDKPREFLLTRETIQVDSVVPRDLDGRIAYVHVKGFQQGTAKEVKKFLDKTYADQPPAGVVLDLRGNSGGVMSAAIDLADLFLDRGAVVTTVEKGKEGSETDYSTTGDRYEDTAVVVLVDHGSASASEIVTAALKYRSRGLVLGSRTFGKGSIQYVNGLQRGALKLTVGQYVGPGMETIQGQGIDPHVQLLAVHHGKDVYLPDYATQFEGEAALPYHLDDTGARRVYFPPVLSLRYVPIDEDEDADEFEYDAIHIDTPIHLAWNILAHSASGRPEEMLDRSLDYLEEMRQFEQMSLSDLASEWGKRWEPGEMPQDPDLELTASIEPQVVSSGERGEIVVTVANRGKRTAPRLYARSESTNYKLDGKTCLLGNLEPGEAASCTMHFKIAKSSPAREDRVFVDLLSGDEELVASTSDKVRVVFSELPRLSLSYRIDDSQGNGNHKIEVGESFQVVLTVTNEGHNILKKGLATFKNMSGGALFLSKGRIELAGLKPGGAQTVRFDVKAQKRPDTDAWKFQLSVVDTDARSSFSVTQELPLDSDRPGVARDPWPSPEAPLQFSQPRLEVETTPPHGRMGDSARLTLKGTVHFGNHHLARAAGVAVYVNGQKIAIDYFGDLTETDRTMPFSFPVDLEEGVNRIVVTAYQKNQSPAYLSLYYNRLTPDDDLR